jgi:hypothetical protein
MNIGRTRFDATCRRAGAVPASVVYCASFLPGVGRRQWPAPYLSASGSRKATPATMMGTALIGRRWCIASVPVAGVNPACRRSRAASAEAKM